jgi:DNA-binding transcriptional LysR family regulator
MDNEKIDLNAVLVFAKVAELSTFRAAARALKIPKSTISVRVAQLEARLGQRLIERTTRSLRLTDAGSAYYRRIAPALDAMHEAERTLDDLKAQPSGRLRVTATIEGGQFLLAPIFAEYMQRYPGVELEVVLADRHVDLVAEGFDLAVRSGQLADSSLIAKRLSAVGAMRLYASAEYLKARGEPRRPEHLSEHDCLVMSSQSSANLWSFQVQRKIVAFSVKARAIANSFVVLRQLAAAGLGIARMPETLGNAQTGGKLRTVLDAYAPPPIPLHAIYPSARHLSPKVRALVELLEKNFAAHAKGQMT